MATTGDVRIAACQAGIVFSVLFLGQDDLDVHSLLSKALEQTEQYFKKQPQQIACLFRSCWF